MDFGYPGGPKIDKLAKKGMPNIVLPKTKLDNLEFSFSGIKTAILNLYNKNNEINKADLCISFEKVATEMLIENTLKALKITNTNKIVLAGGVSANSYIRKEFSKIARTNNMEIFYPDLEFCTDNAAMIGCAGYYNYKKRKNC